MHTLPNFTDYVIDNHTTDRCSVLYTDSEEFNLKVIQTLGNDKVKVSNMIL